MRGSRRSLTYYSTYVFLVLRARQTIEFFIVACTFARFHTFIIVNNYIDISRNMNYNRNLRFGQLEI